MILKNSLKVEEYINNKEYLIYKKNLSYKKGISRIYYLIINNNEIIDVLMEKDLDNIIKEERLSNDNIDLMVYKVVRCEDNKYYSFRMRGCIEYRLDELIEVDDSVGMFFCKDKLGTKEHFDNTEEWVILKVKVKIDDLIVGIKREARGFFYCIKLYKFYTIKCIICYN